MKLKKAEDLRVKCDYCESRSFTLIFEDGKPNLICDLCGLPQKERTQKDEKIGVGNDFIRVTWSVLPMSGSYYTTFASGDTSNWGRLWIDRNEDEE